MISEKVLQEAIAECLGQRNPTTTTCMNLAAYYTVLNELYRKPDQLGNGVAPVLQYSSDTEFGKRITGKDTLEVLAVMDELMEALQAINPRLYSCVMSKL